jgi:hypothetical protein
MNADASSTQLRPYRLESARALPHNNSRDQVCGVPMPTLFRFLAFCAVIVGLAYGAMFALIVYVEPVERDVTIRVPTDKLNR